MTQNKDIAAHTSWLEALKGNFAASATEVARRLETQAEEIRRYALQATLANPVEVPEQYTRMAYDIQHAALWGLANLNVDGFTSKAGEIQKVADEIRLLEAEKSQS